MEDSEFEWLIAEMRRDPSFAPLLVLMFVLLFFMFLICLPVGLISMLFAVMVIQDRYRRWKDRKE